MAALLLSGAGMLRVPGNAAAGAGPGGYGDWRWCDGCCSWVAGAWDAHEAGTQHQESLQLIRVHPHQCDNPLCHRLQQHLHSHVRNMQ